MYLRFAVIFFVFISWASTVSGQNSQLANQYYITGEYEKAAELYKSLFESTNNNSFYFDRYIESLLALEEFEVCKKAIDHQLNINPDNVLLYVTYGNILERQNKFEEAEIQYQNSIKRISSNIQATISLGNAFTRLSKYDLALKTYLMGDAMVEGKMEGKGRFAYYIADIYRRKGDTENMIKYYLISADNDPQRMTSMKQFFAQNLATDDLVILKNQLYANLQENPENVFYAELLEWVFIQEKSYSKALIQAKALDMRLQENGTRVFEIAQISANDQDFNTSIAAYSYLIEQKGVNSTYYLKAKEEILKTKRNRILNSESSTEDLLDLKNEYNAYLDEMGRNGQSAYMIMELANLEAYHLNQIDSSILLLKNLIGYPGIHKYTLANAKIALGDFYVITGEIWEATLLYSQVDKDFSEEFLGEQARFKNAKLSYYNGDFEWAQSQFDVLKASTSKLISNDAIDLSVFIMDNMGLDTTEVPLMMYAQSELLVVQNKLEEAAALLDKISDEYPDHSLVDDILYAKAKIFVRQADYPQAIEHYEKIIANHIEEIRCDNALFELAELYEHKLNNPEKASELYEKLFIEFSNSTLALDARNRYRLLRGDIIP